MTRIADLQKKYPGIHKEIIVKMEMAANGIRDSRDLDKLSSWTRAASSVYASEEEDLTLQRLREETPWRFKDDRVLLPQSLNGGETGIRLCLYRKNRARLTVREVSEDKFALFEGEELVDVEVFRMPWPWPKLGSRPDLVTSRGTPVRDLIRPSCPTDFLVQPVQFCEYFKNGSECRFCNYNPTYQDAKAAGVTTAVTIDPDETAEALRIYDREILPVNNVQIVGGAFRTREQEAKVDVKFIEKISRAVPRNYLILVTSPMSRKDTQRLRDAGLSGLRLQMETFDERLFSTILPGKSAHTSREGWLEAFQEAVEIFGVGNVGGKFVGGVTLQGPEGYSTWQEARDSHIAGDRWMISHGVCTCMQPLRWGPGSPYSHDPANREKFPPLEFYLDVAQANHAAMKEFSLYDKMKTPIFCTLTGGGSGVAYCMDIGIVESAGDYGKWNADFLPYEQNSIGQILDSRRATANIPSSFSS